MQRLNKESMSNRDYFRAWDKFDVEKEIESLEAEDEEEKIKAKQAREGARAREEKSRARREREMEELRDKMKFDDMSDNERKFMSQREKVRRSVLIEPAPSPPSSLPTPKTNRTRAMSASRPARTRKPCSSTPGLSPWTIPTP